MSESHFEFVMRQEQERLRSALVRAEVEEQRMRRKRAPALAREAAEARQLEEEIERKRAQPLEDYRKKALSGWIAAGGDESEFARAWPGLREAFLKQRMSEQQQQFGQNVRSFLSAVTFSKGGE